MRTFLVRRFETIERAMIMFPIRTVSCIRAMIEFILNSIVCGKYILRVILTSVGKESAAMNECLDTETRG